MGKYPSWFSTFFLKTLKVLGVVLTRLWTTNRVFNSVFIQFENLADFQATFKNHPTLVRTTSWANFSNFPKMKLERNLNKLGVVHMVVKMSHTLTSRLTDSSFSASSSIDVKYSQMLTQSIVTCTIIWSFITISSSNSSSLLKELN